MNKERVVKDIRGLIVASKYPVSIRQLDSDYRTVNGEKIPYSKLGYRSLEDFLKVAPTLNVFRNNNGEVVVQAEKLAESAHIVDMVQKQKAPKKPPRHVRFSSRAAVPSTWKPKYASRPNRKYTTSSRVAAVSHSQFVDYQKPAVPSKVVIPKHSTLSHGRNVPPRMKESLGNRLHAQPTVQAGDQVFTRDNTGFVRNTLKEVAKSAEDDCSPGSSRRKNITRMMSEVSLERDSGNSSPVSDIVSPLTHPIIPSKIPDFAPTGDPKVDLKNFVEYHKLGTIDISTNKVNAKRVKMYTCKLTVGTHKFTSYPEEFNNPYAAEIYCYKEAFKELSSKYGKRRSLFLASDKDILDRIPNMLKKHSGGLWEWQLLQDYTEKYNEQLPEDWLKIIDSSPCIHVQKVVDNYTLKHCKPEEVLQKGQTWMKSMTLTDVSVPSNTVEFREDGKLYAEVTFLLSANEIWCRQFETEESDRYIEMITKMEEYYTANKENLQAPVINCNGYYVAEYENNWYRIRALKVNDNTVRCFYIDFGDEITLSKDSIHQMKREFAVCQAQAFVCHLAGLEDLYDVSIDSATLQSLLYKHVILEVATDAEDENDVSLPVFMYDFDTGESINEEMIPLLTLESASPNILNDTITEVFVSNIATNGDIYVQIRSRGYDSLQRLLRELENQISKDPPTKLLEPVSKATSKGKIYFCKNNLDGHWHRVTMNDWHPTEQLAQIYYIDYGNTEVISIKEAVLYPLDKLSDILSLYPAQAVKTRMLLDETPKDFYSIARKVVPTDEPVIIKVITYNQDDVPLAEFFSRTGDTGLFCINKSITMGNEIKKGDDNHTKSTRKVLLNVEGPRIKNVPSGGKLKCPTLPDVNNCLEIHVPLAVNPYNFFVQPLESQPKLHKMMVQLQDRYKSVEFSPLTIDQIIPGNIYASKFEDGNWYRTSVIKVIHDGSISVFYCDFGYYANLTLQKLIPLDIEFLELPYQALKARLSTIKPKHSNWTREHCDEFKELVERKNFYSVLLSIQSDELYDSDLLLDLMLIDTSSPEDVYIEDELIKRNIAMKA